VSTIVYHWINFIILFGFLAFVLKKKLSSFYQDQRKSLEESIQDAKIEHELIQKELEAVKSLSDNINTKVAEIKEACTREINFESGRIQSECKRLVEKMKADGINRVKFEAEKANQSFQKEVFAVALAQAREMLKKESKTLHKNWTNQMVHLGTVVAEKKNYAS